MAFHDRRPVVDASEEPIATPDETSEETLEEEPAEEGTPAVNDPDEVEETPVEEGSSDDVAAPEEADGAVALDPVPPKAPKVITEPVEKLEDKKARLLKEIEELRVEKRREKGGVFQETPKSPPLFVKTPENDLLKDVAPGDVDLIEKVLRAKGYVPKEEISRELSEKDYRGSIRSFTDAWLEKNPEFKPENDPDDENWNRLNAYATKFFNKPSDPKDVLEILDAARDRLFGKKIASLPTKSLNSVAAKKEKIAISAKPSSGGSAASKAVSSDKKSIPSALFQHLKGFSEDELAEIASS